MDESKSLRKRRLIFKSSSKMKFSNVQGIYENIGHIKRSKAKEVVLPGESLQKQSLNCKQEDVKSNALKRKLTKYVVSQKCHNHRYFSHKEMFLFISISLIILLRVSNCQKAKISIGQGLFRSEEDFNNFKEAQHALLQNKNLNINLRKNPGIRQTPQIQKRLGQLNQLQKITGALNGGVTLRSNQNRNGILHRSKLDKIIPQNQKRIRNPGNRNVALRQKQQPIIPPTGSNRHEIIRNWESYKVKRQNSQPFPSEDPNLEYRYVDVTSEGQVLPPIRRNERIDIGEDDLLSRPQRPIAYYPNTDNDENTNYYPKEIEETNDRNNRPLRPFISGKGPKKSSLPSFANFIPKFPSFPRAPPFENKNERRKQPPINRVRVDPTITPRRTTTRTPWTTSVRVPTRKLRKADTKAPQTYYNNRRDGNYYANEVPLNTKYFQVGDEVIRRPLRPTRSPPTTTTKASTSQTWFQPTISTTTSTTSTSTSTTTTRQPLQTQHKLPILVKKLAKRPLSKIAAPKVVSVQVVRRSGNGDTAFVSSQNEGNHHHYGKRLNIGGYKKKRVKEKSSVLCNGILECDENESATTKRSVRSSSPYDKNLTKSDRSSDLNEHLLTTSSILSFLPESFDPFVNILRGEVWVVPILVASCFLVLVIVIFEIYLILQSLRERRNRRPASRRHLFLGQILLLGLLLCSAMAVMHGLKPSIAVCSVLRVGTGLAYVTVYATLLVKLVFLVSLNSGVYLPATYQSLLLCFAILIQVVIGVQWLVSSPAKVTFIGESEPPLFPEGINAINDNDMNHTKILALNQTFLLENESIQENINQTYFSSIYSSNSDNKYNGTMLYLKSNEELHETKLSALTIAYATCNVTFQEEMLGMLYAIFLVIVVVVLAFKARGVRENYREAMYVGLAIGFAVCILLVWVLAAFMVEKRYTDICTACGLISTAAIIFVIMFMPKGRQLSAMGREGVYAEDRTDVYTGGTGSSTQSTGSGSAGGLFFNQGLHLGEGIGGTPSPSFFPIKPSEKLVQQFRDTPLDGHIASGKGNNSNTLLHHKINMRDRLATPPLPSSPKKYRPHVHLHHHNSQNASFDNKIPTAHQQHHHSIHQHNHHSPNRRSFRNNNKQNTSTNSSNFHHAFHDRQRASHRALFGGGPKQLSHNPKNGGGNPGNNHNAFRSSLMRSQELATRFNSDDTHSRFHRARSSPPIHRRTGNGGIQSRSGNNWRASHGDLYTMSDGIDNLGTGESVNFQRLGVQGLRSRFSMHDLHEANEMRASRADLQNARDALHPSRRINAHSHNSISRNDLRASHRSKSGRKGAELFGSSNDEVHEDSHHHHHHHQCSKCAMHDNHHSPRGHSSPKKQKSPHHLPISHTDVFGPGAFHY